MEAYTDFAAVYDRFMDNVPYEEWYTRICEILKEQGIREGLVLELGCGTGTMTELLSKAGYDMIGVDNSPEMLELALIKKEQNESNSLYLLQDMREFELYGTVAAIISVCDSMNYLTSIDDFKQVLKLVENYLDYDGIFLFDLNSVYKYRELLADEVFAENREDCSFIWENMFDEESMLNEYALTLFVKEEEELYYKYEEFHYQRAYELEDVKKMLKEAGLIFLTAFDGYSHNVVNENSDRIVVVCKKISNPEEESGV